MSKSLFIVTASALFLSAGLAFTACKKEGLNGGGGTYTLKGRLLQDCSGTAIAGTELRVSFTNHGLLNSEYDASVGNGTTTADGTFQIECKNQGSGLISLHTDAGNSGVNWVDNYEIPSIKNSTVDLGTIYDQATYYGVVKVNVQRQFGANDTLYYGTPYDVRTVYPATSGTFATMFSLTGSGTGIGATPDTYTLNIVWGVGRRDLDSALNFENINGGSLPPYQRIKVPAKLCQVADTSLLTVQ